MPIKDLGRGGMSPYEVAQAYRQLHPGLFDDADDSELITALRETDPETYQLIDPLLEGSELLLPGRTKATAPPRVNPPVPTLQRQPDRADTIIGTGLRVVPALTGAVAGSFVSPGYGTYAGGAAGAGSGEVLAQRYEQAVGLRESMSLPVVAAETALGAINPAARGVSIARRVGQQALTGGALSTASTAARAGIEEGRLVSPGEAATAFGYGSAFGGATGGAIEGVGAGHAALQRAAPSFGEAAGALPTGVAAPPSSPADLLVGKRAAQTMFWQEEEAVAKQLTDLYGPGATSNQYGRAHSTIVKAKDYLQQLVDLREAAVAIPEIIPGAVDPYTSTSQPRQLESGNFQDPNLTDLVGPPPPPPSTLDRLGGQLEGVLSQPPGPPRLGTQRTLSLTSPPNVPREMAETSGLLEPPRVSTEGPIQQGPIIGGRPPTPEQPRLPRITEPDPGRSYTTGPNAGPRRTGEPHGQPRKDRRRVYTGKTYKMEVVDSVLPAEDPGTYPPEVRRELARMTQELMDFPYEKISGGSTRGQLDALTEELGSISEAVAEARRRGGTSGGAIAGAPVYHEIKAAAKGARAHATREEMIQDLRSALLEGKGSYLSDAAAQVARGRLAQEAKGSGKATIWEPQAHTIRHPVDAGDTLVGWVDEAGTKAIPPQDLDEWQQSARDLDDGEVLQALKVEGLGNISEDVQPWFGAVRAEAVRRGLVRPEQLGLTMEGPGGSKGPSLLDFEGGVGTPPPAPDRATKSQPALPGAETVRTTENSTPEVADLPFALTPPPDPGAAAVQRMQQRRQQGSLLDRLKGEEGVLILNVPAGDRAGLQKWLKAQEKQEGGAAWYSRVEQAIEDGDWDRAWKAAASASVRSYTKAYTDTRTPAEEARLVSLVKGTPLQSDINTEIIASARSPQPAAPKVGDFPPSPRVTQAGAARGKATLGPAGIVNPGRRQRPLSTAAPALRGATLDREVVRLILEETTAEGMSTIPGNQDTFLRLFRQVGEQVYQGNNLKLLREAGVSIPPQELAQHFNATVSEWGRGLQMLQQFAVDNRTTLEEAAEAMSMGGALHGMIGGRPPMVVGARNRPIGRLGEIDPANTLDVLAAQSGNYERAMLANTLQKRKPVGPLRALHDASYAWMLSKWNTALRNYVSFTGRYTVDSLDHALTIPLAQLLGDQPTADLSKALVRERGLTPFRTGTAVTPRRAWQETLQEIYGFTTDSLNTLKPGDARRSIRLLLDQPEQVAQYLGTLSGEDLSAGFSNTPVLRHLTNPKVQRVLTMFNRAQEFSARATVFDSTMRALVRARGHDPTALLQRPATEIAQALGGQRVLDDLLATSTAQALEATFAGRVSKDSLPGALIRFVNTAWPLKLGIPFPKFNFSAAPRWLFDHSPAAILDLVRFPLDAAGITAPAGTMAGGRLYRGVRAQTIEQKALPELVLKTRQAETRQGAALGELLATQQEMQIRTRQVTRLSQRQQQGLPGAPTALQQATDLRDQLARRRERLKGEMQAGRDTVRDLKSQEKDLLDVLADARGINAPNFAQYLARIGTGTVGMLGAALVVRSQEAAEGTRWYEYRVDREGKDPIILDFRPFAPFAQYLFVADVLNDFYRQTNWDGVRSVVGSEEEGMVASPLDWSAAIWNNYEGKYTEAELGSQFAQAFLSISRAAGTTLTITDLMTQNGWPSLEDAARATVGTIGQFLSRFTVPGQQVSDVAGHFSEEEAKVRIPPKATTEEWGRPLAAPLGNVPVVRQLIPERVSQTTGNAVASEYPLLRALAGIGSAPRDFITEEVRRIGVPGQTVFIKETGDYGLDRLIAETYSGILQQELPSVLEDPSYTELRTPARQRDYMQRYIFPALKRAALGEARSLLGEDRYQEAMVTGEAERRQQRQQRLVDELMAAEGPAPPDADQVGSPPPGVESGMVGAPPP